MNGHRQLEEVLIKYKTEEKKEKQIMEQRVQERILTLFIKSAGRRKKTTAPLPSLPKSVGDCFGYISLYERAFYSISFYERAFYIISLYVRAFYIIFPNI